MGEQHLSRDGIRVSPGEGKRKGKVPIQPRGWERDEMGNAAGPREGEQCRSSGAGVLGFSKGDWGNMGGVGERGCRREWLGFRGEQIRGEEEGKGEAPRGKDRRFLKGELGFLRIGEKGRDGGRDGSSQRRIRVFFFFFTFIPLFLKLLYVYIYIIHIYFVFIFFSLFLFFFKLGWKQYK